MALDSPAGPIRARATMEGARVSRVSFTNVPSFVLEAAVPVRLGSRDLRADVAFGGAFYAIVDSEAAGIPVVPGRLADLRKAGMEIKHAVEKAVTVVHPDQPGLHGIYGTIFTGPPSSGAADLRNVTIFADAEVDRSPCGTGTCAVMAVLAAMGLLGRDQTFTHESIIGTTFTGRVVGETSVGDRPAIIPEIAGEAYITGEHTFIIDDDDRLAEGFRL
jgi:trans-L-3-hydroxyproline dehydratase